MERIDGINVRISQSNFTFRQNNINEQQPGRWEEFEIEKGMEPISLFHGLDCLSRFSLSSSHFFILSREPSRLFEPGVIEYLRPAVPAVPAVVLPRYLRA